MTVSLCVRFIFVYFFILGFFFSLSLLFLSFTVCSLLVPSLVKLFREIRQEKHIRCDKMRLSVGLCY